MGRHHSGRGSSAARGYGYLWQQIRAVHIKREPLCRACHEQGIVNGGTLAEPLHVDHIVPLSLGGTNAQDNLQTLCHQHHNEKTAAEQAGKAWQPKGCDINGLPLDLQHPWYRRGWGD